MIIKTFQFIINQLIRFFISQIVFILQSCLNLIVFLDLHVILCI